MKSGVYKIQNILNGKLYIGSSGNIGKRICYHKSLLRRNKHHSIHLQNSYNKNGIQSFVFSIIELCGIEDLVVREQFWIDSHSKEMVYNYRVDAKSNAGIKWTEEQKKKLKGRLPWNTGTKGVKSATSGSLKKGQTASPATMFKKGQVPWNKGIIGKESHMAGNTHTLGIPSWNRGLKGHRPSIKFGTQPSFFSIVSPGNILYEGYGVRPFAKEMGLSSVLCQLVSGKIKKYKGWTLPKDGDLYNGVGLWDYSRTAAQT